MLFKLLLVIHVLSVIIWLGGAVYERLFIVRNFNKAKGTQEEIVYAKVILATEKLFTLATLGVLITGISMTLVAGYGWFAWNWLGLKQVIASIMLVFFVAYIAPRMKRFKQGVLPALEKKSLLDNKTRTYLVKFYTGFDIVHVGILVNIILAVVKP